MSVKTISAGLALAASALLLVAGCTSGGSTGSTGGAPVSDNPTTSSISGVPSLADQYKPDESAPPSTSPPLVKNKTIWYIECGAGIPGCVQKGKFTEEAAKAAGWNFHIADGNLGIADGYNAAIRSAIAAKADAIIVDSFSCQPAQQSLREARAAKIPVLGIESTDCSVFDHGPNMYTVPFIPNSTLTSNEKWFQARGTRAADYIIQATGGKAKLINSPGLADPDYVTESNAFAAEFKKCSSCKVVGASPWHEADLTPNGKWITGIQAQLVKNPDANAVLFPYEAFSLTLGGARDVKAAGVHAISFGGVADPGGIDAVRDGTLTAITNARSVEWEGYAAIDTLNRYFNHKPSVPEGVGMALITKGHNLPATGDQYVATVNFKADYLKAWGVS
jgi:ribose transport system substrate-binding protein